LLVDVSQTALELDIDDDVSEYFKYLDRDGLTYPSSMLLNVFQAAYSIFNICISSEYESAFLKLDNQKSIFVNINKQFWDVNDVLELPEVCTVCGKSSFYMFLLCLNVLGNIF